MAQHRKNALLATLDASFILGAVCTAVFYAIMHSPAMQGTLLHRYTTEHIVEYIVVSLSFWGLVDVFRKIISFPREMIALRQQWLPEQPGRLPASKAVELLEQVRSHSGWMRESRIGKRFALALQYVIDNGSAAEYRDHLQSLADHDADRTQSNYTLLRFVARITPVLGFLGTVVHFGTALNGVSFDEMNDQLPVVVSEMGQAFNTTTAALASAMFMMFAQFACEWIERTIIHSVDRIVERELLNRFEMKDANVVPFLEIVKVANDESLAMIAANLDRQTGLWMQAFDAILDRFDKRQLQESGAWTDALDVLASRHESYDAVREERLGHMLRLIEERQDKFMVHVQHTLEKASAVRDEFTALAESLRSIAQGEGRLTELQSVLSDNLRVIRETQQIDDALHGLTAAIHLLTARHAGGGATKAA